MYNLLMCTVFLTDKIRTKMGSIGKKEEKKPICTVRNFVNANGHGTENGGFSYHSLDGQNDSNTNQKYQNGPVVSNGGTRLHNGGPIIANGAANGTVSNGNVPNGAANGTIANGKVPNGTANGSIFKHIGSYEKLDEKKDKDEDSVELDFSTSSFMHSETDAVVECTKNRS